MIVDDDPITVDLVRAQLTSAGYQDFLVCTDPGRAMDLVHAEEPDVVLLDIMMPSISGLEILRQIRACAASAHVPVIILTAAGDRETKVQALELGATDFLSKPVNFVELMPRVRNALVVKAHQDHLRRYAQELERQVEMQTARLKESYAALQRANETLQSSCAAAEAATRAKSEFLANMSHELRTPLTAIIGFAEEMLLVEDPCESGAERARMLHTIWCNSRHLLRIVNDILDMAIIERGRLATERIPCSPVQTAADVIRLLQLRAEAKGLALSAEVVGPIPQTIQSDPTRLHQILTNLVGNAIKFTEAGSVRLVLRLLDGDGPAPLLQFEVFDTGIGIRPEEMGRLFEPFAQADASTARRFGGTGLGLTICKYLVERLGGTIDVRSEPGKGSTFRATVATGPLEGVAMVESLGGSSAEGEEAGEGGKRPYPARRLKCRVLLAEDAPDNQRLISHILGKAGAEVVVVGDGHAAYDLAMETWTAGKPFDVILTDIQMPGLNGYRLTQRMRQAGYSGRIVALTANVMADEREKCLCAGCDDYLGKPFSRDELIETVARHSGWPTGKPPMPGTVLLPGI